MTNGNEVYDNTCWKVGLGVAIFIIFIVITISLPPPASIFFLCLVLGIGFLILSIIIIRSTNYWKRRQQELEARKVREQTIRNTYKEVNLSRIEVRLLDALPTTGEEALDLLNQIQERSDKLYNKQKLVKARIFLERKAFLYKHTLDLVQNLAVDALIVPLKLEQQKNNEILYQLLHREWMEKFNPFVNQIEENNRTNRLNKNQYMYSFVVPLIESRKKLAGTYNKKEDYENYEKIEREYRILEKINNHTLKYQELEGVYNKSRVLLEKNKLTEAKKELNQLGSQIHEIKKDFKGNNENETIQSLLTAVDHLQDLYKQADLLLQQRFQVKMSGMKQSAINLAPVSVKLHIPVLSKIESSYQYPLYAKILFLGESSVGKTHLILTLIGQEYNINQGSTIGVDEFYLQVKIGNIHYNTQLCIWDLGGQVNYRIVNELWLHDVSCFVLTYDITRPQTFADLRFWMQALQSSHSLTESKIILVGNKIDVGGTAISRDEIQKFCTEFGIKESIIVSAKTKEKCQDLLKLIINQVDWTNLLGDFDGKTYNEILEYIRHLAQREKIIKSHDLIAKIAEKLHNTDLILIKSLIRKYVTQNLLTIGSSDEYYLLDSVYISKLTAETIRLARKNNGQVQKNELLLSFKLSRTQIDILFEYLVQEHIGYLLNKTTFIYPSFLPHDVPTIDPDIQLILDSDPHEIAYKMEGPMDLFVNRFFVQLSIELGSPSVLTNQLGVWVTGAGHQKTATFISTVLGAQEHLIRLKFGGGDQEKVKGQVIHLFQQLCEIYQLKSHS